MLSCRKSNANVWNNNLETQDFRTASRVQPTFSRRFEKSTRPTDCAVPAPGVINGAPTGYAANQPPQNNIQPLPNAWTPLVTPGRPTQNNIQPPPNVGAPLVTPGRPTQCREPAATKPRTGRNTPHPPTPNAADRLCRSGTGRHEWRPYGLRREPATTKQHSTARKRRGATCDARKTAGVTPRPDAGDDRQGASRRTPV